MQRSRLFILIFCLAFSILVSGCIQQTGTIASPKVEKCVVLENFYCPGVLCSGQNAVKPTISHDITCTSSLSNDGTLTLNIKDSKNPQRPLHIFMSPITSDEMQMCQLNRTELDEVKKMPDIFSQIDYCSMRSLYSSRCTVEPNLAPNLAVLKCGNESVVGIDSKGYYHMYDVTFMVGERVDVVDPQTGETNQTAYQRVHEDESCQYLDPLFHSYDCGVNGAFVAIPQ